MLRFVVLFMALLVGLFSLRITNVVRDAVTLPFTGVLADVSAFIMMLFDDDVAADGVVIHSLSTGFGVQIAPGCDGIEAVIILVSAILAFPAPWKHRVAGIVIGFFAIQSLNLVRIISLFYLGQWNQVWFDWFHLYLWQALIVLDALAVWLIWLRYLPRGRRPNAPPPPSDPLPA